MKTGETIKLIKYVTGSVAAVLLAAALQLQFAYAAGIITLLTIQDTKKETVRITAKRMIIFVIMTILSAVIFPLAGYHVWAFGIVLIPYLFSCMALDMKEAIAPIAVLCTHYVSAKSCSSSMILNEFLILVIGAGIGTLWNLYMPDGRRQLLEYQKTVDDKIVYILHRMAIYIELEDKTDYTGSCFDELDAMLVNLKKEALRYMNNHLITEDDYYYKYMQMRARQCVILKRIYADIIRLTTTPEQGKALADFIRQTADEFEEQNNVETLLSELERLHQHYEQQQLPVTRQEFENRSMLYHILEDMKAFLKKNLGFWEQIKITPREELELLVCYEESFLKKKSKDVVSLYAKDEPLAVAAIALLDKKASLGWTTKTHTGAPVPLYAIGKQAVLYSGRRDNTDMANVLRKLFLIK